MVQKIKVIKIEKTEGDGAKGHWIKYALTGEDKSKIGAFEPNKDKSLPSEIQVGDTIEYEPVISGKYINFTKYTILEHSTVTPTTEKPFGTAQDKPTPARYGKSPEEIAIERRSIERQTSLKMAIEFWAGNEGVGCESILENAELFYRWISRGDMPKLIEDTTTTPKVPQQAPSAQIEGIPEFKTADEMLVFACDKVKMKAIGRPVYTYDGAKKKLGIEKPADITSIPAAFAVLFGK